ncbi:hypothetical protein H5410_051000 [Solanum commersonii]|uniref:Uncharacterized protein n=1 Tax=Solanum commersonii TaxID=4109 RepID=A0A9J5WYP8_SOLCO|nr:hypothetical protein H5410_051000 [Solanum commersonii]
MTQILKKIFLSPAIIVESLDMYHPTARFIIITHLNKYGDPKEVQSQLSISTQRELNSAEQSTTEESSISPIVESVPNKWRSEPNYPRRFIIANPSEDRFAEPVGKSPNLFGELDQAGRRDWLKSFSKPAMGVTFRQRAIKNTLGESPSAFGDVMLLAKNGDIRRTAKWFGELDLAHQWPNIFIFNPTSRIQPCNPRKQN